MGQDTGHGDLRALSDSSIKAVLLEATPTWTSGACAG